MRNKLKNFSLTRRFFISMIMGVTLMMVLLIVLGVYQTHDKYKQDMEIIQARSLANQKDLLEGEVDKVIFSIEQLIRYNQHLPQEDQQSMADLKQYLIEELCDLRYRVDGYFFATSRHGGPLFSNGVITQGTDNLWNLTDPDGIKIIQEQHKAFNNPDGVFTRYSWNRLGDNKPSPKISYTKAIPELDWIIGTGAYLEDMNEQISNQKRNLVINLRTRILPNLIILIAYLILSFIIIKHYSSNIKSNINSFSQFFAQALNDYTEIDLESLHYSEFQNIANSANIMIEKRKLSDNALKVSEKRYKQLIETTSEGFWMIDYNMITVEVNESLCRMLGYKPEELTGTSPAEFMTERDREFFTKIYYSIPDSLHLNREMYLRSKSGELIPCLVKATYLLDHNNEFYASFAFITNIKDRKQYEQKLDDYKTQLETLIKERTKDLEEKNTKLENYNKLFIGREFRIKELRDQVEKLKEQLASLSK